MGNTRNLKIVHKIKDYIFYRRTVKQKWFDIVNVDYIVKRNGKNVGTMTESHFFSSYNGNFEKWLEYLLNWNIRVSEAIIKRAKETIETESVRLKDHRNHKTNVFALVEA